MIAKGTLERERGEGRECWGSRLEVEEYGVDAFQCGEGVVESVETKSNGQGAEIEIMFDAVRNVDNNHPHTTRVGSPVTSFRSLSFEALSI